MGNGSVATGSRLGCGRGRGRCYLGHDLQRSGRRLRAQPVESLAHPRESPPAREPTRASPTRRARARHDCRPHSRYAPWPPGLVVLAGLAALAGLVVLAPQQARRAQASTINERAAPLAMVPAVAVRPTTGSEPRPHVSSGCCRALNAAQLGWAWVRGERGGPICSVRPSQGLICSLIVESGSARARAEPPRGRARPAPPRGPSSRPSARRRRRAAPVRGRGARCPSTCVPFRSIRRGTQGSARLAWYRSLPDRCSVDRGTRRLAASGRSAAPASGPNGRSDGTSRSVVETQRGPAESRR